MNRKSFTLIELLVKKSHLCCNRADVTKKPAHGQVKLFSFTLIELLVVIAIIAILAAMLLPALGKVKQISKGTKCINIEKQLRLAFNAYRNDFNDYFMRGMVPGNNYSTSPSNGTLTWCGLIMPYLVRGIDILYGDVGYSKYVKAYLACPAMPQKADSFFYCNYGLNVALVGEKTTNSTHNVQVSKIKAASKTALIAETHNSANMAGCDSKAGKIFFQVEQGCFRHRKKNHTLMVDGHVEPLDFKYLTFSYPTYVPLNQKNLYPQKAGYIYPETSLPFKCWNKL